MVHKPFFLLDFIGPSQPLHLVQLHFLGIHLVEFVGVPEYRVGFQSCFETFPFLPVAPDAECLVYDFTIVVVEITVGALGHKITCNDVVFDRSVYDALFAHLS